MNAKQFITSMDLENWIETARSIKDNRATDDEENQRIAEMSIERLIWELIEVGKEIEADEN